MPAIQYKVNLTVDKKQTLQVVVQKGICRAPCKGAVFSAGPNPARQLLLRPIATGAVVEATKRLKLPDRNSRILFAGTLFLPAKAQRSQYCVQR